MLGNEKLSLYCKKGIEQALVRDLVGPELAFDHAGAGRLVSGHCIKAANPMHRLYRWGGTRAIDCTDFRSIWQPFDRLPRDEAGEQLFGCQPQQRVMPSWRDFGERHEHKSALVKPRVRQDKRRGLDHLAPIIE